MWHASAGPTGLLAFTGCFGGLEEDDDDFVEDDQAATVPVNQKLDFASK